MTRSFWVVCAPGDPEPAQWQTLWDLCRNDHGTMTEFNESTGATRAEISRTDGIYTREEIA